VSFSHYALGSFFGLVPATLLFAYLGSLGRSSVEAASGETSPLMLLVRIFGLAATVVTSVYVTRLSRRALDKLGV
jgi:uncharacterized membrane protein YdjX (TVP38/TMEM64 family)